MKLTNAEQQLMEYLWQGEGLFMKDLLECFPDPKPAPTTVATLLKRMQDKGFVGYRTFGNSRQYYPLVKKESYFSRHLDDVIKGFFDNSPLQFASFFARNGKLTKEELQHLRDIVDNELNQHDTSAD